MRTITAETSLVIAVPPGVTPSSSGFEDVNAGFEASRISATQRLESLAC
jgi:hypothetical protein